MIDAILGIDIGTSSTKAILFDLEGRGGSAEDLIISSATAGWVGKTGGCVGRSDSRPGDRQQASGYRILSGDRCPN
jgi:hypothetical protein